MRRVLVVVAAMAAVLSVTSCQPGRTMYTPCDPAAQGGDVTGTDGAYVLVCRDGEWVPVMTVAEYLAMLRGEKVTPAPVPPRPTTTTTPPPATSEPTTTVTPTASPEPVAVATGGFHSCALLDDHTVSCWGANSAGQLGRDDNNGVNVANPTPAVVSGLDGVTAVAAGGFHTCALRSGAVECWGLNGRGQLGSATNSGTGAANPAPVAVAGLDDAVSVSAGAAHTCAVRSGGTVACWGSNDRGQLGSDTHAGTGDPTATPQAVSGIDDAVAVAAAGNHTCALLADHTVTCWGSNTFGENGNGTSNTEDAVNQTPTAVEGVAGAVALAAGDDHTCVLLDDHSVTCFGSNRYGQLGNQATSGSFGANPAPTAADNVDDVASITAGAFHTCAVLDGGTVQCWGRNRYGELGNSDNNGNDDANPSATTVSGLSASAIAGGQLHTCALDGDVVRCFGANTFGELGNAVGNGTETADPTPTEVAGL